MQKCRKPLGSYLESTGERTGTLSDRLESCVLNRVFELGADGAFLKKGFSVVFFSLHFI